jgi:glycosyltransferase involved in cell wall biosynthesis
MRIALLSTCAVSVPPKAYGGTELVTAELAKMLTRLGHDVTVFATGDSHPAGELRFRYATAVWPPDEQAELRHAAFAWGVIASGGFDVVHAHQAPAIAFTALSTVPTVVTLHHERDAKLVAFYQDFPGVTYVAISQRQAELMPELGVRQVVHHGLDASLYAPGDGDGGYCAFLGRLAAEKAPHVAIDAALAARVPLRLAGAPHWPDRPYFDAEIAPRLSAAGGAVAWVGEVTHGPKVELLRGARALLFPIQWEEPFGLVMIESMLVGTPVIAFARGAAPEVIEDGVTGFIVRDAAEMAFRLRHLDGFDRSRCRARAAERWTSLRMARDYERIYERVASERGVSRKWASGVHSIDRRTLPLGERGASLEGEPEPTGTA